MDLLASQLLQKLRNSKTKTIAVRFLHGAKLDNRSLGYELTDTFTAALAKSAGDIRILDRPHMLQVLEEQKWMAIDFEDPEVFRSVAVISGADAVIHGHFQVDGQFLELSLKAVKLSTKENIAELNARIPTPQNMDLSLNVPVQDPATGVYLSGSGGVTVPTCTYCPQPEYSSEARKKRIHKAQDLFRLTVRSDGRAEDIRLLTPAGYGLDENSLSELQQWRFAPARLPSGTPVPCRIDIEVTYQLK